MTESNQAANSITAEVFVEIKQTMGMVPNFFSYQTDGEPDWMALNWARLKHNMGNDRALDRKTKERIVLTVSIVNQCNYCQVAHEQVAKMVGTSEAELSQMKQVIVSYSSFSRIATSLKIPVDKT
jgi:AhpD family alkylhydroperoxidase